MDFLHGYVLEAIFNQLYDFKLKFMINKIVYCKLFTAEILGWTICQLNFLCVSDSSNVPWCPHVSPWHHWHQFSTFWQSYSPCPHLRCQDLIFLATVTPQPDMTGPGDQQWASVQVLVRYHGVSVAVIMWDCHCLVTI